MSSSDESDCSYDEEQASGSQTVSPNEDRVEQTTEVPAEISFNALAVSISCHPKRNLIAVGMVDGPVYLYTYGTTGNKEIISYDHHKKPCRCVRFSESGEHLFTGSQDATIHVMDLETNSVFRKFQRTDGSALYTLLPIDNYLLASGEENGEVVLWDFRMQAPMECFQDCEDYISSFSMNQEKKTLLATSGDGTLASYNIRGKKMDMRSEEYESDLLSSGIFKHGKKLVVGAGDGSLNIFNWGEFGNISDRFPGHPGSVDSMVVLHEDVVCTGCEDGKVRVVQLFPNRFLGVLGDHSGFSVEGLSLTFDKSLLASCALDHKIKFWDLSSVGDLKSEDVKETKIKHKQLNKKVDNFFEDLDC